MQAWSVMYQRDIGDPKTSFDEGRVWMLRSIYDWAEKKGAESLQNTVPGRFKASEPNILNTPKEEYTRRAEEAGIDCGIYPIPVCPHVDRDLSKEII
jgi:hypothetical protein